MKCLIKKSLALVLIIAMLGTTYGQETKRTFHLGLVYPISTNGTSAVSYSNAFSVNILNVSGEERGFLLSGIASIVKDSARGLQVSGITNVIGNQVNGFAVAGLLNKYRGGKGFHTAGLLNVASDSVNGTQAAGLINTARDFNGLQVAGLLNRSRNVKGMQVAGLVNIARNVKGVQIAGLINVADSSDYPIGLINIIKNGEQTIGVSVDENMTSLLSYRSGGRKLYGIIGLGGNWKNEDEVFALQTGMGAHLVSRAIWRLNTELTWTVLEDFKRSYFAKSALVVLPEFSLGSVRMFAGPSINFVSTDSPDGKKIVKHFIWDENRRDGTLNGLYVGFLAGIHILL